MEIRAIPVADQEFADAVAAAVQAVQRDRLTRGREDPETTMTRVIRRLRPAYPDAWVRRQDTLATDGPDPIWYVFRDARPPRDPVLTMPKPRVEPVAQHASD